jgi:bacterioferritin-associated ferredoxin
MYVCICNGVSDRQIREAVAAGARSFEALQEELEVSTCCGCCEDEVRAILEECRNGGRNKRLRIVNVKPRTQAA